LTPLTGGYRTFEAETVNPPVAINSPRNDTLSGTCQ
jgi:hypothetical protein